MIENLKEWTVTISGIIVFGSMCEMILPAGNFHKYIRLTIGLILVLSLMSPLYVFLQRDYTFSFNINDNITAYNNVSEIEEQEKSQIVSLYKKLLTEKIYNSLQNDITDITAEIKIETEEEDPETFGSILEISITVNSAQKKDLTDKIKDILKKEYGVAEDKIRILYLKE